MKTKYWWGWLIGGILLLFIGIGNLAQIEDYTGLIVVLFYSVLGVITIINSNRLKKLCKQGIIDSKKIKK